MPRIPNRSALASIANAIRRGGVGVLPTDTIYGIVGSALNKKSVQKIYRLRRRNPKKPMIVLVGSFTDLARFGVRLGAADRAALRRLWPGKVSVVLRAPAKRFAYLHRNTKTIAFRMPAPAWLRSLIKVTGPLVAPSANWEGEPPAKNIKEAKRYFGDHVDFYVDVRRLVSQPSTLVKIENGSVAVLRPGAAKIKGY